MEITAPSEIADLISLESHDGVRLSVQTLGSANRRSVVLLHGFGQTIHAWQDTAASLAQRNYQVLNYDARGHGQSDYAAPDRYRIDDFLADLRTVTSQLDHAPVIIGASMGGLTALLAAGEAPVLPVKAMILVDIAPRWSQKGLRKILDFLHAYPNGFDNLEQVRNAVQLYLPGRKRQYRPEGLMKNLRAGSGGRLHWHWDPAMLELTRRSEVHQQRLVRAARGITCPVLLISGGRSELLDDSSIEDFLNLVPQARHVKVAKASHMVAGDDNHQFNTVILNYLNELDDDTQSSNSRRKIL